MEPLVSIGMPVLNCEKTVGATIRSILNQTYRNWELLLIDDGSTDQTLEIAHHFNDERIKIIAGDRTLPKLSLATRLNQAIALSSGDYFARMDGDDIAYPDRLRLQVDYLEAYPEIDLLGGRALVFGKNGSALGLPQVLQSHEKICQNPRSGFYLLHPSWIGRMAWFRTHFYRPQAIRIEDQDLLLRTYQVSQFACLPDIVVGYRVESLSLRKILTSRYYFSLALMEKGLCNKEFIWLWGIVEQLLKACVDVFAISAGLSQFLLRHRFGETVDSTTLDQWQHLWNRCTNESISYHNT